MRVGGGSEGFGEAVGGGGWVGDPPGNGGRKKREVSLGGFASRLPIHCVECVKSVFILLKRLIKWKFSLKGS